MKNERRCIGFTTDDFNSGQAVLEAEKFASLIGPIHGSVLMTDVDRFMPVRQFVATYGPRLLQFELGPHIDVTEGERVLYPWLTGRRGLTRKFLYGIEGVSTRAPNVGQIFNRAASKVLRLFSGYYQQEMSLQVQLAYELFGRRNDMMMTYHDGLHNLGEPYLNYHKVAHACDLPHRGARQYNHDHTWDEQIGFYDGLNVPNMTTRDVMKFANHMHVRSLPTEVDIHLGQREFRQIQSLTKRRVVNLLRDNFIIMQPGKLIKMVASSTG